MDKIKLVDDYYHQHRDWFCENLKVRIHRAVSWLRKSGTLSDDPDLMLVTLWIAFNSLYGNIEDKTGGVGEKGGISNFLYTISNLDEKREIYSIIWNVYSGPVRNLLENEYTYAPFWNFFNGDESYSDWKERLSASISKSHAALANDDIHTMLSVILDRIYTLRNQLIHGGSTYGSGVNRHQLKEACQIMSEIVPAITMIMMEHFDDFDFGTPYYQYIKDDVNKHYLKKKND
ncbi:MAG: hypothetical protein ACI4UM_02875 [Succinivibrio sp.]